MKVDLNVLSYVCYGMSIYVLMFGIPINAMAFVTIERYVWPAWQSLVLEIYMLTK